MNEELYTALDLLEKEKGIPKDYMLEKIRQALTAAYRREHPEAGNSELELDPDKKAMKFYAHKTVVTEIKNKTKEILIEEADALYTSGAPHSEGDIVRVELDTKTFGRLAAQTAKQVLIQGIRESERSAVYQEFSSKEQEILSAQVVKVDRKTGNIILSMPGKSEDQTFVLTPSEQLRNEDVQEGQYLKVYLIGVQKNSRGPQIQISRTHPGLIKRLFEMEVPEIYDGVVEILSVAREPGSRTKIAVRSNDINVDPVGACVGPRGARVNSIIEELNGEKMDIIKYSDNPEEYVAAALAPSEVLSVTVNEDGKSCTIVVPSDQLSLAIGKEGQNARLAAKLTGFKIDIKANNTYA